MQTELIGMLLKIVPHLWLLYAYVAVVVAWALYIAAMHIAKVQHQLGPFAKAHAYVVVLFAAAMDVAINIILGTVLFLDPPREWMLTARLKRYHGVRYGGSWRARMADWICTNLLDRFDPSGDHC